MTLAERIAVQARSRFFSRPFFYLALITAALCPFRISSPALPDHVPLEKTLFVGGRVASDPEVRPSFGGGSRAYFLLDAERVWTSEAGSGEPMRAKLRVAWQDATAGIAYGQSWVIEGRARAFDGQMNPAGFDAKRYWDDRGVAASYVADARARSKRLSDAPSSLQGWAMGIRRQLSARISSDFPGQEGQFLRALFLGERTDLDQDFKDLFLNTGTSHILAVSGFNVAFLAGVLWVILAWVPIPRSWKDLAILACLWMYCLVVGEQSPVIRATVMASVVLIGRILGRKSDGLNALGIAALAILWRRPSQLFDLGFQLSFIAVFALIVLGRGWMRQPALLPGERPDPSQRFRTAAGDLFWSSFLCYFATLPLVVQHFYILTPYVFLANFIVVPISFLLYLGAVPYALLPALPGLTELIRGTLWLLTKGLFAIESLPGAVFVCGRLHTALAVLLTAGIALALSWPLGRRRIRVAILFLFLVVILCAQEALRVSTRRTEWTALDVGQGDAVFGQFRNGGSLLVDGGSARFTDHGRWTIVPFLRSRGVRGLDAVIISHPQEDHYGGIASVLRQIPVKRIYFSGAGSDSEAWQDLLDQGRLHHVPFVRVQRGDLIPGYDEARLEVLHPGPDDSEGGDPNDRSLVVRAQDGDLSILLTGDIEEAAMRSILAAGSPLQSDILKVPHHGSRVEEVGRAFFRAVSPRASFISAGRRNPFGHPAPATVEALRAIPGNRLYLTARDGALTAAMDRGELRLDSARSHDLSSSHEP